MKYIGLQKYFLIWFIVVAFIVPPSAKNTNVVALSKSNSNYIRLVRMLESDQTNLSNPAGLSFSSKSNTFHVIDAHVPSMPKIGRTDLIQLNNHGGRTGSASISTAIVEPINMAFDNNFGRLLLLQTTSNQLLELQESSTGKLNSTTLIHHDARAFGINNPQGMAIDSSNGELCILDNEGPRLVCSVPKSDGSFSNSAISEVDLSSSGLVEPHGLAFDPTTGHLYTISITESKLYELDRTGQSLSKRDLSPFLIENPQGIVFAPSGDQTDDPAQMSLYLAESVLPNSYTQGNSLHQGRVEGKVLELSFVELPAPAPSSFVSSLVRTTDLALISPPSPDPSGLSYLTSRNSLILVDGEVEETVNGITHFQGVNVWEMTLSGSVIHAANISSTAPTLVPMSNEPNGAAWNPTTGHYFFSDDNADKVFDLNPGIDGLLGTADDSWTSFTTSTVGSADPEGITFDTWSNHIFVVDGTNAEVYEFTSTGNPVGHFDVQAFGVVDPESVEYNPESGTLFVLSNAGSKIIVETTTSGNLLQTIDLSMDPALSPAGLAYAPASDGSATKHFYIVDRAGDNNVNPNLVDGKMFELTAPVSASSGNRPPLVDAGQDQTIVFPGNALLDGEVTDDGLPNPPGSLTVNWSQVSGPSAVTFGNINDVDTTVGFSMTGVYNLRLTAADGEITTSDDIMITVTEVPTVTLTPTPTATTLPMNDWIFGDDFESGNLSTWSASVTNSGNLSIQANAGLVGNLGLSVNIVDSTAMYVSDTSPVDERHYRARFYFDPNSISMVSGDTHNIFYAYTNSLATALIRVPFIYTNSQYRLRMQVRDDNGAWLSSSVVVLSDAPHIVELEWQAASAPLANDGRFLFWLDGVLISSLAGLDNDARTIEQIRLGPSTGVNTGTRGIYYLDAFESRRFSYIGPVLPSDPTPTFTLTSTATPTVTITRTPNFTSTATETSTATSTLIATPTYTSTVTATAMPTRTPTSTSSATASSTSTPTPTRTATIPPTWTSTGTPTGTSAPLPDFIFADGFEAGNLLSWTYAITDSGDLSVSTIAALANSHGLQALINDNNPMYVIDDSPLAETSYRARFYFDPNSIRMGRNNAHIVFSGLRADGTTILQIEIRFSSGKYQIRVNTLNDTAIFSSSSWVTIDDAPHFIEFSWKASTQIGANNGSLTFWVDGIRRANLTGIDNDTRLIDRVMLGGVSGIDDGTRGTYYFDSFESRRFNYIGPIVP